MKLKKVPDICLNRILFKKHSYVPVINIQKVIYLC